MRRLLVAHRLEIVAGLAASLPVLASGIHSVLAGWVALGDDAVIATRAYDVPTTHTPLLGQHSASSEILGGGAQNSLGPMLYWLLALPVRVLDPRWLPLVIALTATAAIVGAVILARRRGGLPLMLATALGTALMCSSIEPQYLSDLWNPSAPLLPLLLLAFVTWSVAAGEVRLLPLAVVLFSFVVQAHLTYVLPAAALAAVAAAGLWRARPAGLRRAAVVAAVAGLVCWAPPLLEQAVHRPGNLVQVAKSATAGEATLGAGPGWRAGVRTAGVPPWWLRPPRDPLGRLADVLETPGVLAIGSAALLMAWLAAALAIGLRRGRVDVAAAAAQGLLLPLAAGAVAAGTPTEQGLFVSISYTLWWASPAGLFTWLAAGWTAAVLLAPGARSGRLRAPAVAVGLAATVAAGAFVAARTGPERLESAYDPVRAVAERLDAELGGETVLVDVAGEHSGFDFKFDVHAGLVFELRRRGVRVVAPDLVLGSWYDPGERRAERRVLVRGSERVPAGERLVGRFTIRENRYHPGKPQVRDLAVTLSAAPG